MPYFLVVAGRPGPSQGQSYIIEAPSIEHAINDERTMRADTERGIFTSYAINKPISKDRQIYSFIVSQRSGYGAPYTVEISRDFYARRSDTDIASRIAAFHERVFSKTYPGDDRDDDNATQEKDMPTNDPRSDRLQRTGDLILDNLGSNTDEAVFMHRLGNTDLSQHASYVTHRLGSIRHCVNHEDYGNGFLIWFVDITGGSIEAEWNRAISPEEGRALYDGLGKFLGIDTPEAKHDRTQTLRDFLVDLYFTMRNRPYYEAEKMVDDMIHRLTPDTPEPEPEEDEDIEYDIENRPFSFGGTPSTFVRRLTSHPKPTPFSG